MNKIHKALTTYDNENPHSLLVFDSAFGTSIGSRVLFQIEQPFDDIYAYSIQSIIVHSIPDFIISPVFYLVSSLSTAATSNKFNGKAESIIAVFARQPPDPVNYQPQFEYKVPIGRKTLNNIDFQLRDYNYNPLPNLIRFVVSIIFYQNKLSDS